MIINTCCSYGESPLVEEIAVIGRRRGEFPEPKEMFSDEPIWGPTERKRVAEEIVAQPPSRSVQDVGEHDVHRVLGSDWAGAEHREAELHCEHQVRREQKVGVVDCVRGVGELVGYGGESAAYEGGGGGGVGGATEEGEEVCGWAAQGVSHFVRCEKNKNKEKFIWEWCNDLLGFGFI